MRRTGAVVIGLAAAAALWAGVGAQQEMLPRPGPGSGAMNVNVINHPAVTAAQSGEWSVSLARTADVRVLNAPTVHVPSPDFLRTSTSYRVRWTSGPETDTITVVEIGHGGWVRVENGGARRWLNLSNARSIEEAR